MSAHLAPVPARLRPKRRPEPLSEFYRWRWANRHQTTDQQAAWLAGWHEGAAAAIEASSDVMDLAPTLWQILVWIERRYAERSDDLP